MNDKQIEKERYDKRASEQLTVIDLVNLHSRGLEAMPIFARAPYEAFETALQGHLFEGTAVLEIGAGTGAFTKTLLRSGATVTATDISPQSLAVLLKRTSDYPILNTREADMENLPFDDQAFDVVVSSGSLSYGNNQLTMDEIYRVLKKNGCFICVDSLNHNPIYRFNRYIHYLRGRRTVSTLKFMPTLELIDAYQQKFGQCESVFFGSLLWMMPVLSRCLGSRLSAALSNGFDRMFNIKASAFKFVMIAKKN